MQDHGIGIRREFLPNVFHRFRQGGSRTGAVNRGLGLGMSISRDIVERHAGTITAESAGEGKGATFTVKLPLRAATEPVSIGAHVGNEVMRLRMRTSTRKGVAPVNRPHICSESIQRCEHTCQAWHSIICRNMLEA